MKPIRLNAPPPLAQRPRCPQCAKPLAPWWATVKSERIERGAGVEYQYTLQWNGEYRSYGAFDTMRCAVAFANAAHAAGYRLKAKVRT